jgi:hypothetical protein
MMEENSWEAYRIHITEALETLKSLETKVNNMDIKIALLKFQAGVISGGIAVIITFFGPYIIKKIIGGE